MEKIKFDPVYPDEVQDTGRSEQLSCRPSKIGSSFGTSYSQQSYRVNSDFLLIQIFSLALFLKHRGTMGTESLKKELDQLKKEKAAFWAQSALIEKFISMVKSPDEPVAIKTMLRETIEIAIDLTDAELGSLIVLRRDGTVADSILCRGEISPDLSAKLICTVLKEGLAGWVIQHGEVGLVNDTEKDARWITFSDQPYTARSALALPITSGDKQLGILTLMHSVPDHFTPGIVELMKFTANQLALVLENANLYTNLNESYKSLQNAQNQIETYSRALDVEMEKCRQIQRHFLPKEMPSLDGWQMETFFFPANRVSGDFYDVFSLPGEFLGLDVGDVCDKGVGSALFMALFRSLIRIFSGQAQLGRSHIDEESQTVGGSTELQSNRKYNQIEAMRTVALTNDYIAQNNDMNMFATLFFGVLDPENGKLLYTNGGHETVFIIDNNGIKNRLLTTGPALGVIPHAKFGYKQIQLEPGDILFAYTDGVTDARSTGDERYGRKQLNALLSQPVENAFELMQRIGTSIFNHIGIAPQADDITMLAFQRLKSAKD
jgi:sigma-B regulation protein RsbU (phosphoserine phosphatase)